MVVYVDDADKAYGRMKMCHMIADSTQELLEMVDTIGVDRRWIQAAGTPREHFDVCSSKRDLAIKASAQEVTTRDIIKIMRSRE